MLMKFHVHSTDVILLEYIYKLYSGKAVLKLQSISIQLEMLCA